MFGQHRNNPDQVREHGIVLVGYLFEAPVHTAMVEIPDLHGFSAQDAAADAKARAPLIQSETFDAFENLRVDRSAAFFFRLRQAEQVEIVVLRQLTAYIVYSYPIATNQRQGESRRHNHDPLSTEPVCTQIRLLMFNICQETSFLPILVFSIDTALAITRSSQGAGSE